MRQEFFFYPHKLEMGSSPKPVPMEREPDRVWTLFLVREEGDLPELPMKPQHRVNAFLEDKIHDWNWRNGKFRYVSRVSDGEQWLLLEYKE